MAGGRTPEPVAVLVAPDPVASVPEVPAVAPEVVPGNVTGLVGDPPLDGGSVPEAPGCCVGAAGAAP